MTRRSELLRMARRLGWAAEPTGSGHWRLTHADTTTAVIVAATPQGGRWRANALADLRRALRARNQEDGR